MEIIEGLLGSSLVGFHTHDYVAVFSDLRAAHVRLRAPARQPDVAGPRGEGGHVSDGDRVRPFRPSRCVARKPKRAWRNCVTRCAGQKVIFSVDRLDYTKGLINRLRGYELFLKSNPQWHGKVVFMVSVAPSRIGVESYQAMKLELEQTVGRIVGDFGNVHWTPLIYQFRNLAFDEIVATLPIVRRGADHAVAGRHEPGGEGIRRVAARPDGRVDPERNGRCGKRNGRGAHHQPVSPRGFCAGAGAGADHAGRGADQAQQTFAGTAAALRRGPLGG